MDEQGKEIKIVEEKTTIVDRLKVIKPKQLIVPVVIVVLFIGTIIGIINYQQRTRREQNPKLEITGIADGQIYEEAQIVLEGNTYFGTKVFVNDKETPVDKNGKFRVEVPLKEGLNEVKVVAESVIGKKTEVKKVVTRSYEKPEVVAGTPASSAQAQATAPQQLDSSGPENFWIPEILSMSGVLAAWQMSRKKLKQAIRK